AGFAVFLAAGFATFLVTALATFLATAFATFFATALAGFRAGERFFSARRERGAGRREEDISMGLESGAPSPPIYGYGNRAARGGSLAAPGASIYGESPLRASGWKAATRQGAGRRHPAIRPCGPRRFSSWPASPSFSSSSSLSRSYRTRSSVPILGSTIVSRRTSSPQDRSRTARRTPAGAARTRTFRGSSSSAGGQRRRST